MTEALLENADLIDAIFAYIVAEFPEMRERAVDLKEMARGEFGGDRAYIARRPATERQRITGQVMALFNGRNATEIARRLNISRASVYRIIKTDGGKK